MSGVSRNTVGIESFRGYFRIRLPRWDSAESRERESAIPDEILVAIATRKNSTEPSQRESDERQRHTHICYVDKAIML